MILLYLKIRVLYDWMVHGLFQSWTVTWTGLELEVTQDLYSFLLEPVLYCGEIDVAGIWDLLDAMLLMLIIKSRYSRLLIEDVDCLDIIQYVLTC